ncbi:MAG: glycosyltransferase [Candidatus Brocadia sp. AMX2]|uniref:Glycosyltransferase group 1 n=1 Tax=Candidatus Brocadia sinica JPN1 TaxID=1197129 RepID=A0ABQ0JWE5_9BACT|nr:MULTISPECIES: glycosyltransferase [Brocadia]KXK29599.1 MAG: putative glucosyltransferase [Candidatus Brocadia sinica]MBC6931155.1 glycosyltransferase [Candidatus Brocadia sp.]MBL1167446.1 glycosyltransferase [Candidatus Brocadia sp. AMX1]NOG41081.1 glycosyltransferase [Planctomycetota bacterium]KAA0244682.1 MAG: glycosyltransferase [Candidatus Brocadia sp. AMX2]
MKHLIVCSEYPPAPGGGIGTYGVHIARLLAEKGETVHVIGKFYEGSNRQTEEQCNGRLIIHRLPYMNCKSFMTHESNSLIKFKKVNHLFKWSLHSQSFSWQASLLTEKLIEQEGIDIIESQDYEAPLYFFQLRRAMGLGPKRRPPCFIHLHSPIEFITQHNDWDIYSPSLLEIKRLEDFSITTADALLCPSRYLANQAEEHYGLQAGSIRVIPLPIGDNPILERNKDTWEYGKICYMGRLERRKGIIEWIDAAAGVAHKYPDVHFEFIGANILATKNMSGEDFVMRRIPDELKTRFHFLGHQERSLLPQFLAKARIAVVPSRWENFPYSCVEAMCSGLPVLASREGGMVEMIEDGKTGWLAKKTENNGLAEALERALETPPKKIAEMGSNASASIRQMCDNKKILERHLDFRSQIVNQGPKQSLNLPVNLSWSTRPLYERQTHKVLQNNSEKGIAIVVTCFNTAQFLTECLQSIEQQTQKPAAVIIVDDRSTQNQALKTLAIAQQGGWHVILKKNGDVTPAKNTGIEAILNSGTKPLGFSFLNAHDRLKPNFIATCESILKRSPEVGLVSCWAQYIGVKDKILTNFCPSFPYQWLSNEAIPFGVVRTQSLREAGYFRSTISEEYDTWDLFNAVMAAGWAAATIPEILGELRQRKESTLHFANTGVCGRTQRKLFERFPDLINRDAKEIALLAQAYMANSVIANSTQNKLFQCILEHMLLYFFHKETLRKALLFFKKVKNKTTRIFLSGCQILFLI